MGYGLECCFKFRKVGAFAHFGFSSFCFFEDLRW